MEEALDAQISSTTAVSESAQSTTPLGPDSSNTVRDGFESQLPRLMGEVAASLVEPISYQMDPLTCLEATTLRDLAPPGDALAEQYWILACLESLFTGVVGDLTHTDIRSTDSIMRPYEAEVQALVTLESNTLDPAAFTSSQHTWRLSFALMDGIWVLADIRQFNDRESRDLYEKLTGKEMSEWEATDVTETALLRVNPDARPPAPTGETRNTAEGEWIDSVTDAELELLIRSVCVDFDRDLWFWDIYDSRLQELMGDGWTSESDATALMVVMGDGVLDLCVYHQDRLPTEFLLPDECDTPCD